MTTTPVIERDRLPHRGPLILLCAAMFLVLLDVSSVNVALPSIERDLGGGTSGAQAVVDGYTVPLAALLLATGAVADRWSPRRCFVGGLLGFGSGSLIAAAAPNLPILLLGRGLQGASAAAMLPASMAMIGLIWTDSTTRARAVAMWAGVSGSAVAIGPVVGGALVAVGGWRPVFAVNLPVVLAACLVRGWLPRTAATTRRVDWSGAGLSVVALGAVVGGVILLGRPGEHGVAAALVAIAVVGAAGFAIHQGRAKHPVLARELWRNSRLRWATAGAFVMNLVGNGTLLILTFVLQGVQGRSALSSGLLVLPNFLPLALVPLLGGRLMVRLPAERLLRWGYGVGVVGEAALAASLWLAPLSVAWLIPGMALAGAAIGVLVTPLVATAVQAAGEHGGAVGGLTNAARQTGTSIGVAVFGLVAGPMAAHGAAHRMAACFLLGMALMAVGRALIARRVQDPQAIDSSASDVPRRMGAR